MGPRNSRLPSLHAAGAFSASADFVSGGPHALVPAERLPVCDRGGSHSIPCPWPQRWRATILVSLILASSGILLELGQPSIFAISLLIIGSSLFLCDRMLPFAALLLLLSLAVKPQIGGLIVLYLLVRGIHRRYAAVALAGAFALLLSAGLILRMNPSSANWTSDISANISASMDSGFNNPRPANEQAVCNINLQAITSIFFADARKFNAAAWGSISCSAGGGWRCYPAGESGPGGESACARGPGGAHADSGLSSLLRYPDAPDFNSGCGDCLSEEPPMGRFHRHPDRSGYYFRSVPVAIYPSASRPVAKHCAEQIPLYPAAEGAESGTADSLLFIYCCDLPHALS